MNCHQRNYLCSILFTTKNLSNSNNIAFSIGLSDQAGKKFRKPAHKRGLSFLCPEFVFRKI